MMMQFKYLNRTFVGRKGTNNPVYEARETLADSCRYDYVMFPEFSLWAQGVARDTLIGRPQSHIPLQLPLAYNFADAEPVPSVTINVLSRDVTDRSEKAKDFRDRVKRGEIVLKPMEKCDFSATLIPGGEDVPGAPYSILRAAPLKPTYSYVGNACGYEAMNKVTAYHGIPIPPILQRNPVTTTSIAEHFLVANTPSCLPPSQVAHEAVQKVLAELTREWDRNLITTTVAEANAGMMDVLTELGEARETIGFIFGSLREVLLIARDFRSAATSLLTGKAGKSAETLATRMATLWMQFRYAVSPIGYSVNDALSLLTSYYAPYQSFRRGANWQLELDLNHGWTALGSLEVVDRVFVKHRYAYDMKTHNMGFNPFATAWELTPLSFVVDWALNIGDLLQALWVPQNVSQVAAQYSRQIRPQTLILRKEGSMLGDVLLNCRYYKATPFDPLVEVRLNYQLDMTTKRWADALSLSWLLSKDIITKRNR